MSLPCTQVPKLKAHNKIFSPLLSLQPFLQEQGSKLSSCSYLGSSPLAAPIPVPWQCPITCFWKSWDTCHLKTFAGYAGIFSGDLDVHSFHLTEATSLRLKILIMFRVSSNDIEPLVSSEFANNGGEWLATTEYGVTSTCFPIN